MNIIVCIKPVCDVSIVSIDPDKGSIDSDDVVYIVNPYDMVAVEEAVRIKEKEKSVHVTLISMTPPANKKLLQRCLALGADEAILLWDDCFDKSDSFATATVLAQAIRSLDYDLVLCGQKAIDSEDGQVGSIIAETLDIPLVGRVVEAHCTSNGKGFVIKSKLEKGNREELEVTLPALLTVERELNEPRYASLPSLIASLRYEIQERKMDELGLLNEQVGLRGSNTEVYMFSIPKPRPKKPFTPDSSLSAAERMKLIMSGGIDKKKTDLFEGKPQDVSSRFIEFLSSYWNRL